MDLQHDASEASKIKGEDLGFSSRAYGLGSKALWGSRLKGGRIHGLMG